MESYVISVSVGTGCYRHIQIGVNATLYKLHQAIINAFDFEDDHEHAFFMDNHIWMPDQMYVSTKLEPGDRPTKKYTLKKLGLKKGMAFKYVFDFGDEWRFQCKVLRELDEKTDIPCIIRSVGESPEQYPEYEDWDEEYDEDEDGEEPLTPEEMDRLYEAVHLPKDVILTIRDYLTAAANFYGLITLDKLYDLYNSQNELVKAEDFFIAVAAIGHGENDFAIIEPEISAHSYMEALGNAEVASLYLFVEDPEKDLRDLRRMQKGKTYKQLPKTEFLKHIDDHYFPMTPQRADMIRYLRRREKGLTMSADELCDCIQSVIVIDTPLAEVICLAETEGLTFDKYHDIGEFAGLFQALNNHTHKHANCGYTPDELFAMSERGKKQAERNAPENQLSFFDKVAAPQRMSVSGTPSRNAPCPCGSGRKYKNCCGKLSN